MPKKQPRPKNTNPKPHKCQNDFAPNSVGGGGGGEGEGEGGGAGWTQDDLIVFKILMGVDLIKLPYLP